jgi:Domain of unknown function (DUF1737)
MAQILTYHILRANSSDELSGLVQEAIRADWQPFGSLAVTADKHGNTYAQAIVQVLPEVPAIPAGAAAV